MKTTYIKTGFDNYLLMTDRVVDGRPEQALRMKLYGSTLRSSITYGNLRLLEATTVVLDHDQYRRLDNLTVGSHVTYTDGIEE